MEAEIKVETAQENQVPSTSRLPRKRKFESVDDGERRKLVAERKKIKRLEETPEARALRLSKDAARKAHKRATETAEEKAARLKRNAENRKAKLARETPEERSLRLEKRARRRRESRVALSEGDESIPSEDSVKPEVYQDMIRSLATFPIFLHYFYYYYFFGANH